MRCPLDLSLVRLRATNAYDEINLSEDGERFDKILAALADIDRLTAELFEVRLEVAMMAEQVCQLEEQLYDTRDTIHYLREGT